MGKKLSSEARARQVEAIETLRKHLKPGRKVYASIVHVSRSGMMRHIRLYVAERDGSIWDITSLARTACNLPTARKDGWSIAMGGCGMDMGFQCVYLLGRVLFPNGGPLKASRREHQERRAGATRERDGGYLLEHRHL